MESLLHEEQQDETTNTHDPSTSLDNNHATNGEELNTIPSSSSLSSSSVQSPSIIPKHSTSSTSHDNVQDELLQLLGDDPIHNSTAITQFHPSSSSDSVENFGQEFNLDFEQNDDHVNTDGNNDKDEYNHKEDIDGSHEEEEIGDIPTSLQLISKSSPPNFTITSTSSNDDFNDATEGIFTIGSSEDEESMIHQEQIASPSKSNHTSPSKSIHSSTEECIHDNNENTDGFNDEDEKEDNSVDDIFELYDDNSIDDSSQDMSENDDMVSHSHPDPLPQEHPTSQEYPSSTSDSESLLKTSPLKLDPVDTSTTQMEDGPDTNICISSSPTQNQAAHLSEPPSSVMPPAESNPDNVSTLIKDDNDNNCMSSLSPSPDPLPQDHPSPQGHPISTFESESPLLKTSPLKLDSVDSSTTQMDDRLDTNISISSSPTQNQPAHSSESPSRVISAMESNPDYVSTPIEDENNNNCISSSSPSSPMQQDVQDHPASPSFEELPTNICTPTTKAEEAEWEESSPKDYSPSSSSSKCIPSTEELNKEDSLEQNNELANESNDDNGINNSSQDMSENNDMMSPSHHNYLPQDISTSEPESLLKTSPLKLDPVDTSTTQMEAASDTNVCISSSPMQNQHMESSKVMPPVESNPVNVSTSIEDENVNNCISSLSPSSALPVQQDLQNHPVSSSFEKLSTDASSSSDQCTPTTMKAEEVDEIEGEESTNDNIVSSSSPASSLSPQDILVSPSLESSMMNTPLELDPDDILKEVEEDECDKSVINNQSSSVSPKDHSPSSSSSKCIPITEELNEEDSLEQSNELGIRQEVEGMNVVYNADQDVNIDDDRLQVGILPDAFEDSSCPATMVVVDVSDTMCIENHTDRLTESASGVTTSKSTGDSPLTQDIPSQQDDPKPTSVSESVLNTSPAIQSSKLDSVDTTQMDNGSDINTCIISSPIRDHVHSPKSSPKNKSYELDLESNLVTTSAPNEDKNNSDSHCISLSQLEQDHPVLIQEEGLEHKEEVEGADTAFRSKKDFNADPVQLGLITNADSSFCPPFMTENIVEVTDTAMYQDSSKQPPRSFQPDSPDSAIELNDHISDTNCSSSLCHEVQDYSSMPIPSSPSLNHGEGLETSEQMEITHTVNILIADDDTAHTTKDLNHQNQFPPDTRMDADAYLTMTEDCIVDNTINTKDDVNIIPAISSDIDLGMGTDISSNDTAIPLHTAATMTRTTMDVETNDAASMTDMDTNSTIGTFSDTSKVDIHEINSKAEVGESILGELNYDKEGINKLRDDIDCNEQMGPIFDISSPTMITQAADTTNEDVDKNIRIENKIEINMKGEDTEKSTSTMESNSKENEAIESPVYGDEHGSSIAMDQDDTNNGTALDGSTENADVIISNGMMEELSMRESIPVQNNSNYCSKNEKQILSIGALKTHVSADVDETTEHKASSKLDPTKSTIMTCDSSCDSELNKSRSKVATDITHRCDLKISTEHISDIITPSIHLDSNDERSRSSCNMDQEVTGIGVDVQVLGSTPREDISIGHNLDTNANMSNLSNRHDEHITHISDATDAPKSNPDLDTNKLYQRCEDIDRKSYEQKEQPFQDNTINPNTADSHSSDNCIDIKLEPVTVKNTNSARESVSLLINENEMLQVQDEIQDTVVTELNPATNIIKESLTVDQQQCHLDKDDKIQPSPQEDTDDRIKKSSN